METKPPSEQPFAQRRDQWMRNLLKADKEDVSAGAKNVGIRLALYMHEGKQYAFPSYDELGQETGLSARMVQVHTQTLEAQKWIRAKRKRNAGNTYELRYWWTE